VVASARRWTLPLAALLGLLAASAPALAHADLMDAEPDPNTELASAPDELVLDFSEPLEDRYTRVQVLDANDTDHVTSFSIPENEDRRMVAQLDELETGLYTVQWRALSSADGHTTSGSYLLGVATSLTGADGPTSDVEGSPSPSPTGDGSTSQVGEGGPGEALARALGFLGASLAAGVPAFLLLARGVEVPDRVRRRWRGLAVVGAGLGAAGALGVAASLAARTDLPLTLALATTPGRNLVLRAAIFATAGGLLALGARWRDRDHGPALAATGALAASAGLLVTSLGSHAAADGVGAGLAITVDWLHQAAVAVRIAGVAALAVAGLDRTSKGSAAKLIRRFSPVAVASVALVVTTGLLATTDRLSTPGDLLASLYGFALSAKMLLLAPLVALGAYHRYRLLPRLDDADGSPGHSGLRRSALLELALMVVVLVAAGLMATTSPPTPPEERAPYTSFGEARAAEGVGPIAPDLDRSELGELSEDEARNLTLRLLEPSRQDQLPQGPQPVWLLLSDGRGDPARPVTDAEIAIEAWMPEHGHGTQGTERDPTHVHEGMYEAATDWTMPGAWQLRVDVSLPAGPVLHYRPTLYVEEQADPLDQREPAHTVTEDGYRLEVFLTPQPVQVGVQNLTVRVNPTDEPTLPENADVVANLEPPGGSGEGDSLELERWREDAWTREDAIFTDDGEWTLLVALQGRGTYVSSELIVDVHPG